MIKLYNVTVTYSGEPALTNLSLTLAPREFTYVTGSSGAGKSTLLRTIYADVKPARGVVQVNGKNVSIAGRREVPYIRRDIGVIFQDFKLIENMTVVENVRLPLDIFYLPAARMRQRISSLLTRLGISRQADTKVMRLSGGEKQRVAVARALINNPAVILADEPTGNLDAENAAAIMRLLHDTARAGATVLVASHDEPLIEAYPARRIKLTNGTLAADIPAPGGGS